MKKITKILALALGMIIVLSSFGACGNKEKAVNTGGKFTYWVNLDSRARQTIQSYNELLMYQEMEKATGTKIEFLHPSAGTTGTEAFQILMSSGDYPDMIEYSWMGYTGGADQAIADGVIISLNEYMEDYAPNYYSYLEGEKAKENDYRYKTALLTDKGNYFGFSSLAVNIGMNYAGIYVRKDMLDKWGLDIPVTIDDWTNVFEVAKENGVKYPLTADKSVFAITGGLNVFNGAWNVGKSFYLDNGKVKFGPFENAYKDYLKQMADWSKSGYIDIDFITNSSDNIFAAITSGDSIASFGYIGSALGKLLPAMAERNPEFNVVACPFPVMNKGDKSVFQSVSKAAADPTVAISAQCGIDNEERYKEAIQWCDYLYSDEGLVLKCFGIEGNTFNIEKNENGEEHYVYTDTIFDHEKLGAHSVEAALYHFMRPAAGPGFGEHSDYLNGFYPYDQQKDALNVWNENSIEAFDYAMPSLSYTGEEASKNASIQAVGRDNLDAAILNIIMGKQSIDTYDKAIDAAKKAGYEELIKINQNAYNRSLEKLK